MNSNELKGKRVVIAPFSTDAIFLYHKLICDGIQVIAFMDKDSSLHNSSYLGTMVIPYFHFAGENIVAITAKPGWIEKGVVYRELVAANYSQHEIVEQEEIEFCCEVEQIKDDINLNALSKMRNLEWMRIMKRKIYEYTVKNGFSVKALNLVVTTRCSLKCRGCSVLMGYFDSRNQKDISLEEMIRSFNLIMEKLDFVNDVIPIGGEPFLYRDIDKLLLYLASSEYTKKIGRVLIITNGTILPNKSTFEILGSRRDLFQITLSDYGNLSIKRLEFVSLLNQYGCYYRNCIYDTWYLTNLPTIPSPNLTIEDVGKKCEKCECHAGGRLRTVGKRVYTCHFVAFAAECHAIPHDKRDYLDVDTDVITKECLRKFVSEIQPGMAYCDSPTNRNKETNILIPVAEQTSSTVDCFRYE